MYSAVLSGGYWLWIEGVPDVLKPIIYPDMTMTIHAVGNGDVIDVGIAVPIVLIVFIIWKVGGPVWRCVVDTTEEASKLAMSALSSFVGATILLVDCKTSEMWKGMSSPRALEEEIDRECWICRVRATHC